MNNGIEFYFIKYLSDKFESRYHFIYNDIFESNRDEKITLLEIGLGTLTHSPSNMIGWKNKNETYQPGASLRAFRDYFINGLIYGIDMQADCMFSEDRITTFLFDSRDNYLCENNLNNLVFDYIIDDGDHLSESQIKTFENLYKRVKNGGYYFIEDVAFLEEVTAYFEKRNYDYEFHNRLLVIKKQ